MGKPKIILFGGSFDPIHKGHIHLAGVVREKLGAERLIFVPAHRSPHKKQMPATGYHRFQMIQRAIAGSECFSVSDCELNRGGSSYTLDTIHFFRDKHAFNVDFHWLIGADQLADFDKWYKVSELLDSCRVSVMYRAGYPKPNFDRFHGVFRLGQITQLEQDVVETPLIDINSTEIRRKLADGILPCNELFESVVRYIQEHQLYGYSC